MATYSLSNFLGTPVEGDTTLKIYDKTRKLRYEINPNIAYFFTKSNIVIIRIEDRNDIYLDFENTAEAAQAIAQLNEAKQKIINPPTPIYSDGSLNPEEQRILAYYHALSKDLTFHGQNITEPRYKSAHNVRIDELWGSSITPCTTFAAASAQTLTNSAITLHEKVELTRVPDSNGEAYYYNDGSKFVRPWVGPLDIPFPNTSLPSDGFTVLLYRGDDATKGTPGSLIGPLVGAWIPDYYTGIIHFGVGNTPDDLGWGSIRATFFEYTGVLGVPGVTDAFTSVVFNSGTSELVFNSGETTEARVVIPTSFDVTSLSTALSVEKSTRIATDTLLSTGLSTEISGRTSVDSSLSIGLLTGLSKDTSLSIALSGETIGRISTDTSLSTVLSTEIQSRIGGNQSLSLAVSTETSLRTITDSSLSTGLSTTLSKDISLSSALSTETSTRTTIDTSLSAGLSFIMNKNTSLSNSLSLEANVRSSTDVSLSSAISTETSTRMSTDSSLSIGLSTTSSKDVSFSTAISTLTSKDISLSTGLSSETSVRSSVDTLLSNNISSETSVRTSVDALLSTNLSTEASVRGSVDTSLSTAVSFVLNKENSLSTGLSSEASVRSSVNISLSTTISTESSTRSSSDLSLSSAIIGVGGPSLSSALITEISTRSSVDASLSNRTSSEISTRVSVDSSLLAGLSTEISVRGSVDTSLSTSISTGLSTEASTRSSVDTSLSTAVSITTSKDISLSTGLSTESSVRSSVDTSLSTIISTGLSTEASTRSSVDTSLSTAVSITASKDISLSTALSTETLVRSSVDTSLSTAISTGDSLAISTAKSYTDAIAQGVSPHAPVRVVTTGMTTLWGYQYIDGIGLAEGDSILVTSQDDKTQNGIYIIIDINDTWVRRSDADGNPNNEIELGDFVFVESGLTNANSGWVLGKSDSTGSTITPDVDTQEWYKMAAPGSYVASGIGIDLVGNMFNISSEISTRTSMDTSLSITISTHSSIDISVQQSLSASIVQTGSGLTSLTSVVSSETSSRTSVDTSLSTLISTETSTRSSVDTSLSNVLSTETLNRISGDTSLSTLISGLSTALSTEFLSRISGDTSLSTELSSKISTEVLSRISGDTSLSTVLSSTVSTESSSRISGDNSLSTLLSTRISTEASLRLSGDTRLSTLLSTDISTVESEIVSLSQVVSTIVPGGSNLVIEDEFGVVLTGVTVINFIGASVRAQNGSSGTTSRVNVFIPPPTYASHFNTLDGTTYPTVAPVTTTNRYIALPTSEGNPYKIGSWGGGEIHPTIRSAFVPSYTTVDSFSILDTTTTFTATVLDADGTTPLATHTTTLSGNSSVTLNNITIITSGWTTDAGKFSAIVTVNITIASILPQGGRFSVLLRHNDGIDGIYSFTQNNVFRDSESLTAYIGGTLTVIPQVPIIKQISGVFYYTTGSEWNVNLQSINNVNSRSYPITEQLKIAGDNLFISETLNINGEDNLYDSFSGGTWTRQHNTTGAKYNKLNWTTDLLDRTNWLNTGGISGNTALATLYDWTAVTGKTSPDYNYLIDTFVDLSDRNSEMFRTETFRLQSDLSTPWDSSSNLTGGTGLQILADRLVYPKYDFGSYLPNIGSQPDYSGMTGSKYYFRKFVTNGYNVSNGIIQFTDYNITESDLSSNYVKLEISIDSGTTWYSLNSQYTGGVLFNGAGCRVDILEYGLGAGTIDSNALRFTLGQMQLNPPLGTTTFIHLKITFTVNANTKYIGGIDLIGGNWI